MDHAMVIVPAAPVRRKPGHRRELVNQLLFGETVKIIREKGELWVKTRSIHDGYEGWMTRNLLQEIKPDEAGLEIPFITSGFFNRVVVDNVPAQVPVGASLPGFSEGCGSIGGMRYTYAGEYKDRTNQVASGNAIEALTHLWLNAPYLWGGRTMFGVDCSGFVQVNFKMMGIDLPRDAWQQAQEGQRVKKLKDGMTGDLAFFDDKEEIVHVGILLGNDRIIHASGKVRIDNIDKKGIINSDTGRWTHRLKAIRRFW